MSTLPLETTDSSPESRFSWSACARLIRLGSQTGTMLLLLPTLWSLTLASRGLPPWRLTVIFVAGSFLMRSAGVALNDLADRSFDRHVARTSRRPLASGELSPAQALLIVALLLLLAGILVLLLDPVVWMLSPIAVGLAALYPFAKRVIHIPQAMLGIAFGWGTVMAWAAVRGTSEWPAWLLFAATVCWAVGYDTIYALQDLEDDRRIGVKSSALWFGPSAWLAVGLALAATLGLLALAGRLQSAGWAYFITLVLCGWFALRQTLRLRRPVSAGEAFALFRQHVWMGTAILAGLLAGFA